MHSTPPPPAGGRNRAAPDTFFDTSSFSLAPGDGRCSAELVSPFFWFGSTKQGTPMKDRGEGGGAGRQRSQRRLRWHVLLLRERWSSAVARERGGEMRHGKGALCPRPHLQELRHSRGSTALGFFPSLPHLFVDLSPAEGKALPIC